jgi:ribosome recycling factor
MGRPSWEKGHRAIRAAGAFDNVRQGKRDATVVDEVLVSYYLTV